MYFLRSPCHQKKTASIWLHDFDRLWDSRRIFSCSNPEQTTLNLRGFCTTTPCGGNAVRRAMFCRQCRKLDTAVSGGYKGNAQSTTEASSAVDRVRQAQRFCLFYPVIKWAEEKGELGLKPAICWLECVCVCVDFMWPADSPRLSVTVCLCAWGELGAAGLLYHSSGYTLDSSRQDVGDCVMSHV